MSVQTLAWVIENSKASGTAYTVLLMLSNHEGDHDGDLYCWPSIDTIAREARCSRRTTIDALATLEGIGELTIDRNAGPHGTNIYRVSARRGSADSARVQSGGAILHPNRKEPKALRTRPKGAPRGATLDNRPDHDQIYLVEQLAEAWDQELGIPALQKLNNAYGRVAVSDALRSLHGFPPEEAVRSVFAYVEEICKQAASA